MTKLITGGCGFIGAELAHMLVGRGEEVVIFDKNLNSRISDIRDKVKVIQGDLSNWCEVMNVVRDYKIKYIYHLGAMLSYESEVNPWVSFQANVVGTYNVLEAARLYNVEKVMFSSSGATFGPETGGELTDTTIQRPSTVYGVYKLCGEGLGRFYRKRFGLDFRSIRYPALVGPGVTTPGHWDAPMIESAILGKPYECPVAENNTAPMMFFKDAARAADLVLQAPKKNIKMVNYNIAGVTPVVSAKELEKAIKKFIPGAIITYASRPSPHSQSYIKVIDDSYARTEWDWKPACHTIDQLVAAFIKEMKAAIQ